MTQDYRFELFIFPDGTEVEMCVFDKIAAPFRPRPTATPHHRRKTQRPASPEARVERAPEPTPLRVAPEDVKRCPICSGELVYPIDWERHDETTWDLTLRCPDCETQRHARLDRKGVEHVNRDLYQSARALTREAETVERRNFEDEVERIADALKRDLILPMDF